MEHSMDEAVEELSTMVIKLREQFRRGQENWQSAVTDLTNLRCKVALFSNPVEPKDMNIAL